jgi:hypothetical protein
MTFPLLFVGYHLVVAVAVAILLLRFLTARQSVVALTILAGWLAYAAVLGASGTVGRYDHVPGLLLLVGPIILALLALALSQAGGLLAARVPLALLLGFQVFRVGVELSLHHLWSLGLAPRLITLKGGNVEILIAVTAPIAAWLVTRGPAARRLAWAWNLAGIVSLGNVVARAVLSAPGPLNLIRTDVPDIAILTWPFTFVPGFMAPLAMMLHIVAFRAFHGGRSTPHNSASRV